VPQIALSHIWKVYGKGSAHALEALKAGEPAQEVRKRSGCSAAIRDVSLTVEPGEIFVLMGLSGSGKSTLLRMINGLISPSAGTVEINGQRLPAAPSQQLQHLRRSTMAMVLRRRCCSCWLGAAGSLWPLISTVPAEGLISPLIMRSSVDFPEPESPISTKISPGSTVRLTSRMAALQPLRLRTSCAGSPAFRASSAWALPLPYTFQMCESAICGTGKQRVPGN